MSSCRYSAGANARMVLMRNETFGREFILALVLEVGLSSAGAAYLDCHRPCAGTMHCVLKQCILLDQHTDHIGE